MSLLSLLREVHEQRAKILKEIEDEDVAKEVSDKLGKIHRELKELDRNLQNTSVRNRFTRKSKSPSPTRKKLPVST